jgi:hypothetical protein
MRYLAAKRSVDDRALNWQVWQRLVAALPRATTEQPLHILEVGAGIGSMVERLLAGDVLTHATYTAIDKAPALLTEAHRRLFQWADDRGFQVDKDLQGKLHFRRLGRHITIETEAIDVAHFMAREHGRRAWDLMIGQAFLDLIDMPTTLPGLCSLVRPDGLLYFPTTFDGDTVFQPESDTEFDRLSRPATIRRSTNVCWMASPLGTVAPDAVCLPTSGRLRWRYSRPAAPIG